MIDEVYELNRIESGDVFGIPPARACWLLVRQSLVQGAESPEIRKKVLDWARVNEIAVNFSVNQLITLAKKELLPLRDNPAIYINEVDRAEINARFDRRNTRRLALAMLCINKAEGGRAFTVSLAALAGWLGMDRGNMSGRHMKELREYGYIDSANSGSIYSWNGHARTKAGSYRLLVPSENKGEWRISKNDIDRLYTEVFGS